MKWCRISWLAPEERERKGDTNDEEECYAAVCVSAD